jgi:16S rRNA (cytosine1402-N4)-methyltransferase
VSRPMHIPVLAREVLEGLALKPHETVIDGTLGAGGHAALMLETTSPDGKLYGFDRDARNIEIAKKQLEKYGDRLVTLNDSFGNMEVHGLKADAILMDLGFSSMHVDDASRGFSFMYDGPLDMRYDLRGDITAADIVNSWSRDDLATLFRRYGEDRNAQYIAKTLTEVRKSKKFATTLDLADAVAAVIPRRGKLHPATFVFQALRIAVNDELGELERGLKAAENVLNKGGRIAIITFHSLEDRIVKQFFKESHVLEPVTKRPIVPGREEVLSNSRSRSAKLRIAIKR